MNEAVLLEELLGTDKTTSVRELIETYIAAHGTAASWRPVGGRPNNSGTIQAAGDPARALIERVTNAIDAVIERAHNEHKGLPECGSPREAVQAWFGVPPVGLHKLSNAELRKLAEGAVLMTLLPGDGRAKRCIDVADAGTGLSAPQMPGTILSLNESNKLDKFYLAGAFGQGGSATFASSEYTLIASRATGQTTVAFTVVRYDPPQGVKLGSYVYLVKSASVLVADSAPSAFGPFATHVRHYGYDLDDYPSPLGPSSLYGRAQGVLFEPVLPFMFDNRVHDYRRTMKGARTALNGARDEGDPDSKLSHSIPLFFTNLGDLGQIGIEYWVLEPNLKSAPNKAFVNGNKPVVLSLNGQTHAEWSANLIRKDADLLHIASRMVVHLDCNRLSLDAKRILFVSNREESRKGLVQNAILQEMLGALKSDPKLAELNEEAKNAGLKERDEKAEKEVRQEVARMLRIFGFSVAEDAGNAKDGTKAERDAVPSPKPKPHPAPEPVVANDPPTFVELVADEPVTFYPGQRRFVRIRTDALSKYHNAADPQKSRFSFMTDGTGVRNVGSTELREGHMRAVFAADPEVEVGGKGRIIVELRPPASPTLAASLAFVIVAPPPTKPSSAKIHLPEIDIQPVSEKESEEWQSLGWGDDVAEVAADYVFSKDTLTIRYSTLFPRYGATYDRLIAKDAGLAESFRRRYEIWLTTSVLIHWQDTEADGTALKNADLEADQIDDYRRDEMRRMAKAAIVYSQREVQSGAGAVTAGDIHD